MGPSYKLEPAEEISNNMGPSYKLEPAEAEIKIIYYIQESEEMVYVTDFFPTEKDDTVIPKRNQ